MPHCVFMHKADSIYDDVLAERYQFPKPYLTRAQQCVGDWIVYLEPTKVRGSRGYFAVNSVVCASSAGAGHPARLASAPPALARHAIAARAAGTRCPSSIACRWRPAAARSRSRPSFG